MGRVNRRIAKKIEDAWFNARHLREGPGPERHTVEQQRRARRRMRQYRLNKYGYNSMYVYRLPVRKIILNQSVNDVVLEDLVF